MKRLLIILLLTPFLSKGVGRYVSNAGNDAQAGVSPSTAWQTVLKVNSASLTGVDTIYFRRGDTFVGGVIVSKSTLVFAAYGTGANPIISGFATISSWTNVGGNIWESNVVGAKSIVDIITVSGEQVAPGRYPNTGYFTYQSSATNSYTASGLSGMPSFTGGECVARKERWIMDRQAITSNSGTTLNVATSVSGYNGKNGAGLFVQKHINCLDLQNEWVFTASTGKLSMYSVGTPATTKICVLDTLFDLSGRSNITIDGIDFQGAGYAAINAEIGSGNTIKNCNIRNAGQYGIYIYANSNVTINNTQILDVTGLAIKVRNSGYSNTTITNNTINRSGWIAGLGWHLPTNQDVDDSYSGMVVNSNSSTIQYNIVDSIGYKGINFNGSGVLVANNFISNYCMTKDDGGGIYTWANDGNTYYTDRTVRDNIIMNSIGAATGSTSGTPESHGIYMDGAAMNVYLYKNTILNGSVGDAGLFCNNTLLITARLNTFYNVDIGYQFNKDPSGPNLVRQTTAVSNIVYPNTENYQYWNGALNAATTIQQDQRLAFTKIDSNYYRSDVSDPFYFFYHDSISPFTFHGPYTYVLTNWKPYINAETVSSNVSTAAKILPYNPTSSPTTYGFSGLSYKDVYGTIYNNSVTVPAWGSVFLIYNGTVTNTPPTANAGIDQSITLPTNTTTLNGSGSDADGTIVSYQWSKVSGPAGVNFGTSNTASITITNLIQGTYIFQLLVTDNGGAFATDQVQIIVNPAPNVPPTANAGPSQNVVLPTSSATLVGSGTDTDGTITTYAWTKDSGPACTITSPSSATTSVTGLTAGIYVFRLTVTDNLSLTGFDTMRVFVSSAPNVPPTASAGIDQTITLPTNSVTLTGSGSDVDGVIVSYLWTKILGTGSTVASPASSTTAINSLLAGTYRYELTVTDNLGLTGKDTVQVTVNNAANTPPTANAGANQTITLPINTTTLNGSGTDPDGTIVSYQWLKLAGSPAGSNFTTSTNAVLPLTNLIQGVYQFSLTVTDNLGGTGTDTVQVTVNPSPNANPIVTITVPSVSITLPINSATLAGTATDDGTITGYSWSKASGPASYSITTVNAASTSVTNLVQGTYQFVLTATDNLGATGSGVMTVTVLPNLTPIPSTQIILYNWKIN